MAASTREGSALTGSLTDTYVAALQHDLVDVPAETTRVGVVRKPTRWFHGVVDENRPALGPPTALLEDAKDREESFAMEGLCDEEAHNAAWEAVDFEARYREYLETDANARAEIDDLQTLLDDGEDVALVCYENTDQKRCHRTILRDLLTDGR